MGYITLMFISPGYHIARITASLSDPTFTSDSINNRTCSYTILDGKYLQNLFWDILKSGISINISNVSNQSYRIPNPWQVMVNVTGRMLYSVFSGNIHSRINILVEYSHSPSREGKWKVLNEAEMHKLVISYTVIIQDHYVAMWATHI